MPTCRATVAVVTAALALGACTSARETPEGAAAAPAVITYTASDYAFTGPAEIPAGAVTLRLANEGQELHHAVLARLDSGRTLGDVMQFYADEADPLLRKHPGFLTYLGGPGTGFPDSALEATTVLTPGEYVLICYIPSADGQIHFQKGMTTTFTVTPSHSPAPAPQAWVQLMLRDYEFRLSQPLVAPPGELLAGVGGISPSQIAYLTVALEPGTYAFVCFVPDHDDGAPHFAHGMVHEFEVS